ncbi:MAG: toxin-antitoxin system YwqK family antitoxin [Phycisphaerales bacterium]
MNGPLRRWHDNGVLAFESTYIHDVEDGTAHFWDEGGKLIDSYVMSRGTGIRKIYNPQDGTRTEAPCRNGMLFGAAQVFGAEGKLLRTDYYIMNRKQHKLLFDSVMALEQRGKDLASGKAKPTDPIASPELAARIAAFKQKQPKSDNPADVAKRAKKIASSKPTEIQIKHRGKPTPTAKKRSRHRMRSRPAFGSQARRPVNHALSATAKQPKNHVR